MMQHRLFLSVEKKIIKRIDIIWAMLVCMFKYMCNHIPSSLLAC